jgi:hypothetical protein
MAREAALDYRYGLADGELTNSDTLADHMTSFCAPTPCAT